MCFCLRLTSSSVHRGSWLRSQFVVFSLAPFVCKQVREFKISYRILNCFSFVGQLEGQDNEILKLSGAKCV